MSHFLTLVIGEEPEEQLAKYDESLKLPLHLYKTKEQLISEKREKIERYKKENYDVFLADPEKYRAEYRKEHVDYVEHEFPKMLAWTDEQMYEDAVSDFIIEAEDEDGNEEAEVVLRKDGSVWHVYNDDAKWDWYVIGGRYAGRLRLKDKTQKAYLYYPDYPRLYDREELEHLKKLKAEGYCDQARVKDISNLSEISCFAVVKDGKWYERGKMGWWGVVTERKAPNEWESELKELLENLPPDTLLTMFDCHI